MSSDFYSESETKMPLAESFDREPLIEFLNQKHLDKYLRMWQKILFLEDWVIHAVLVDAPLYDDDGKELSGNNSFQIENKCAFIRIVKPSGDMTERVIKYCAELTLVHELLHCKRGWLQPPNTMEGLYFDVLSHQALEEEARSYLLARYNITKEWFNNIGQTSI